MFQENLAEFFQEQDFAGTAVWNQTVSIPVILDREFIRLNIGNAGVESSEPAVLVQETDIAGVAHGDILRINEENYIVRGIQPDGHGLILLIMEKEVS